jgi:hypothetical protein
MRICLANRRKGNSKGKLYLGSNQFLGCGIAGWHIACLRE